MFIKNYLDYQNSINEGLIKTHPGDYSSKYINDLLKKLKFDISVNFENDIIYLSFNNFNKIDKQKIDDLFDTLSATMTNMFGWFPSSMLIELDNGLSRYKKYDEDEIKLKYSILSRLTIEYDSKFDDVVNYKGDLFHLSIQDYNNKILKYGLFPKSKSKISSHIDRIYLCKTVQDCVNLIPAMKLHYSDEKSVNHFELNNKKWNKNTNWIIYKIKNKGYKLYKDTRYKFGFYTMENIKPEDISIEIKES
jgi:hypothetical protein